jgi:hypothetical protein
VADAISRVAEVAQGPFEGLNRVGPVDFRRFIVGQACRQIFLPQVVSQANQHGTLSLST